MDTKVKVGSLTETHQAVLATTMVLGAFFVGMSMIFALSRVTSASAKIEPIEPAPLVKAMAIKDVTHAQMLSSGDIYFSFRLSGYTGANSPEIDFGDAYYTNFQDTDESAKSLPLFVKTYRDHYSTVITLDTNAGVKTICLPENIKSGGDIANDEHEHIYYIDADGNSYFDLQMTRPTGVDCPRLLTKTLHPYPITGGEVYSGSPYYIQLNRDYLPQVLINEDTLGANPDMFPLSIPASKSPLQAMYMSPNSESYTQSEGVISITWDNTDPTGYPIAGVNLCIPEMDIQIDPTSGGAEQGFYDINGYPYSDVMLTQRIPCEFPIPTCADTDGDNQYTQGTVSGIDNVGRAYSENDYCVDTRVIELSCMQHSDGDYLTASLISCEHGCSDGACIQSSACTGCDGLKPPACCSSVED